MDWNVRGSNLVRGNTCRASAGISVPGVERPGCDVKHLRPVTVKNRWSCTSAPPVPSWRGQGKTWFSPYLLEYLLL